MDLVFTWQKIKLERVTVPLNKGKAVFLATVPTAGFDIECAVTPSDDGHSYDWTIQPVVYGSGDRVVFLGVKLTKDKAFTEASDAIADLEKALRREMATCHAKRPSMFAVWKDSLARAMQTRASGMKPWT